MTVRLEWKPQDLWIGAFWKAGGPVRSYVAGTGEFSVHRRIDLWVCVLPMVPIHFTWMQPVIAKVAAKE